MKLSAPRSALLKALSYCSSAIERKSPNFAATCVLLTVADGLTTISATDGLMSARTSLTTLAAEPGSFGLPAAGLLDRIKALGESDIAIEVEGASAVMKQGKRKFTLKAIGGADFPNYPVKHDGTRVSVGSDILRSVLSRVAYAQHEDTDGKWSGTQVTFASGILRAEAATGRGLAVAAMPFDVDSKVDGRLMLTKRAAAMLLSLCDAAPAVVLDWTPSMLHASAARLEFAGPMMADQIPDFLAQIPPPARQFVIAKAALLDALRVVGVATGGHRRDIALRVEGATLHLEAKGEDGNATDEVECKAEAPCHARMPLGQLTAAIESADGADVQIETDDLAGPNIVRPVTEPPGCLSRSVIMSVVEA